jgi:ribosome-binding factor A
MQLRIVPDLRFVHDTSVARGVDLSRLIGEAIMQDKKHDEA